MVGLELGQEEILSRTPHPRRLQWWSTRNIGTTEYSGGSPLLSADRPLSRSEQIKAATDGMIAKSSVKAHHGMVPARSRSVGATPEAALSTFNQDEHDCRQTGAKRSKLRSRRG